MPDTKEGREKQARAAENRQIEREIREARDRADEAEPPSEVLDDAGSPPECHRRGCPEPASFVVLERYQEETGQGAVEARAFLCREHTAEESPVNLDRAYPDYVFRVDPLSGTTEEA
ncbi:MAG: hypothetical protein V5A85_08455 [Haloarculaceae archaeon]